MSVHLLDPTRRTPKTYCGKELAFVRVDATDDIVEVDCRSCLPDQRRTYIDAIKAGA